MSSNEMSSDDVIAGLKAAATVEEAVAVLKAGRAAARDLSADECLAWIDRLWPGMKGGDVDQFQMLWQRTGTAVSQLGDVERDPIYVAEVDLVQELLTGLERGGASAQLTATAIEPLLREIAEGGESIRPPRRGFVDMYVAWLESGYDPGIFTYANEVLRMATPVEAVRIGTSMPVSSTELSSDHIVKVLDSAIRAAKELDPGAMPRLAKQLEEVILLERRNQDSLQAAAQWLLESTEGKHGHGLVGNEGEARIAVAEALLERTRAWLAGVREEMPVLEQAVLAALTVIGSPENVQQSIDAAIGSLKSAGSWVRIDATTLQECLTRRRDVVSPRWLLAFPRGVLRPLTIGYLRAYQRHLDGGEAQPAILASAITAAIEDHARCVLASGLPASLQEEVSSAGLGKLAAWVCGVPLLGKDDGRGHRYRVSTSSLGHDASRLKKVLQRAGRVRDDVHHQPEGVSERTHGDLFAEVQHHHSRPSILVLMRRLRVVPT